MLSQEAIEHLEVYGYCLIEDAISTDRCDQMAEKYFQLHQDPDSYSNFQSPGEIGGINQTLFGTVNRDEMCWDCIVHPHVLEVVRHFLGPKARLGEACTKWIKPGAPMAGIHVDSTHDLSEPFPDVPWLINSMWMITDFTVENGATVVVPMSHKSKRPPVGLSPDDKRICSIVGRRGSVILWHGGAWHGGAWHTSGASNKSGSSPNRFEHRLLSRLVELRTGRGTPAGFPRGVRTDAQKSARSVSVQSWPPSLRSL